MAPRPVWSEQQLEDLALFLEKCMELNQKPTAELFEKYASPELKLNRKWKPAYQKILQIQKGTTPKKDVPLIPRRVRAVVAQLDDEEEAEAPPPPKRKRVLATHHPGKEDCSKGNIFEGMHCFIKDLNHFGLPLREWIADGYLNLIWVIEPLTQKLFLKRIDDETIEVQIHATRPTSEDIEALLGVLVAFPDESTWCLGSDFGPRQVIFKATLSLKHRITYLNYKREEFENGMCWYAFQLYGAQSVELPALL